MLSIVQQIIEFYTKHLKIPTISDLKIEDDSLLQKKWSVFVTIYKNWEIRWSAWNIKEIKANLIEELIENTIICISKDPRFSPLKLDETSLIKIRIDLLTNRKVLNEWELAKLDPVKSWVLVIKKDYEKMATILPNINPSLLTWENFIPILKEKLIEKEFDEKEYIIYEIQSETFIDF